MRFKINAKTLVLVKKIKSKLSINNFKYNAKV